MSLTVCSTSRHRRKRSAASLRRAASVSGEWKRPVRRAMAEAGRKEESLERGRALVRGRTMMGIWVPSSSIMRLSSTVGATDAVSVGCECATRRGYLMAIKIQEQYTVV
jgi:hypothetical protein